MTIRTLGGLFVVVAIAGLSTGCAEKEKQMIADLEAQYNELSQQNENLRSRLAESENRRMQLQSEADQKDTALAARNQEIRKLQEQLADSPDPAAGSGEQWERGLTGDRVTVGSDILFASGSATLTGDGKQTLDRIAADLRNQYAGKPVRVYGYTDSDPIRHTRDQWQDNLDLSAGRAMAVTRYLIEKGIDEERIETVAMGETNFVASNDTAEGKARNRRVEIIVIR